MEETPGTLAGIRLHCEVELQEPEPSNFMPGSMGEPIQHLQGCCLPWTLQRSLWGLVGTVTCAAFS